MGSEYWYGYWQSGPIPGPDDPAVQAERERHLAHQREIDARLDALGEEGREAMMQAMHSRARAWLATHHKG